MNEARLHPFMWVDDLAREAEGVSETRGGNLKLSKIMGSMELTIHPTKSKYIVSGIKKFVERLFWGLRGVYTPQGELRHGQHVGQDEVFQQFGGGEVQQI